jgi:hypothetical protein
MTQLPATTFEYRGFSGTIIDLQNGSFRLASLVKHITGNPVKVDTAPVIEGITTEAVIQKTKLYVDEFLAKGGS